MTVLTPFSTIYLTKVSAKTSSEAQSAADPTDETVAGAHHWAGATHQGGDRSQPGLGGGTGGWGGWVW